jgi:hypothetical protein
MLKALFVGPLLACWMALASAAPIVFTSSQFLVSTVATTATLADADMATSPPSALPLVLDSTVFDANDFASGAGIASPGLLSTSADVTAVTGLAAAAGQAEFIGTFIATDPAVLLQFPAFSSSDFVNGLTAFSGGSLLVRLMSGTSTLYDQLFTVGTSISAIIPITVGTTGTLDILLFSEASVISGGSASNTATASFTVTGFLPEPAPLALLALGIAALVWSRRTAGRSK